MIKWVVNRFYKHSPTCICGYRMKPNNKRKFQVEDSWECLFTKKCGWETYQTLNGKLHWFKKSEKK